MNETKQIPLSKGLFALISAEDYEMVNRHKWHVTSHGYAARNDRFGGGIVYLHRAINRTPDNASTDHIDGDRLNCKRDNLRTVTSQQNSFNQSKRKTPTSSCFKGVSFVAGESKDSDRWESYIKCAGVKGSLGCYVSEMDAALAYNIKATELFGVFAKLNELPLDFLRENPAPRRFCKRQYSKTRGVSWNAGMKKWLAYACKGSTRILESWHATEVEAIQARADFDASRKEPEHAH